MPKPMATRWRTWRSRRSTWQSRCRSSRWNLPPKPISVPLENPLYRMAQMAGVLKREGHSWSGDYEVIGGPIKGTEGEVAAGVSEVACLRFGQLHIAGVPGELYPELVYGKIQEPADPNADFPDAPLEKSLTELLGTDKFMLIGLANDELGYIIPKRQWDHTPPFAYGRKKSQYGEENSCGPLMAGVLMGRARASSERIAEGDREINRSSARCISTKNPADRRSATMTTGMTRSVLVLFLSIALVEATQADEPTDPSRPAAIATTGVPAVPQALVDRLTQYQNMRSAEFLGWSDEPGDAAGILIRTRFGNSVQLHRVYTPGGGASRSRSSTSRARGISSRRPRTARSCSR